MGKIVLSVLIGFVLIGCGSGGVDSNKTVAQITQEVQNMDLSQIQSKIDQYKKAIEAKSAELEPLMAELKKIPVTEMLGEDAKKIKADMEEVKNAVSTLKQKLDVYVKALQSKQNS